MYFFINESSYFIDFLINIFGTIVGAIISLFIALLVFQWQRIKKEQSFAKILLNILNSREVKELMDGLEDAKERNNLNDDRDNTESEYFGFIFHLEIITNPLTAKLPDLKDSYQIGTGYVYEIYDLRRIYSYFEQFRVLSKFAMENKEPPRKPNAFKELYGTINKIVKHLPEGIENSKEQLEIFVEKKHSF